MRYSPEQTPEQWQEYLCLRIDEAHEIVARNFLPDTYRYAYTSQQDTQDIELSRFRGTYQEDIASALRNDEALPRTLDLLTQLSSLSRGIGVSAEFAEKVNYNAAQLIAISEDRLRETAEANGALRGQALSLLCSSYATMGPLLRSRGRDYLADNLIETVQYDISLMHSNGNACAQKYQAAVVKLLDRCTDTQITTIIGAVDRLLDHDDTRVIGAAMYEALSTALPDFPPFVEGKSGNGQITRSQYITYGLRLRNWLLCNANNAGEQADAAATFAALKADGEMLGLSPLLWSAALRELHSPTYCSARNLSHELVDETLEHFGFSYTELLNAWREGRCQALPNAPADYATQHFDSIVRDNLRTIQRLESHTPGSAVALRKQFGLRNLSRYPLQLLVQQYQERDDADLPYGVMIYSTYDHNDALYVYNLHDKLLTLHKAAQEAGFGLRLYECASITGVARALLSAKHTYHRKLGFIVGVGHGWEEGVTLSKREDDRSSLTVDDLWMTAYDNPKRRERYRELFALGATGALFSCNTGQEFGVGDALADFLDLPLTAPTARVSCKRLGGHPSQEGFDVTIQYEPDVPRRCGSQFEIGRSVWY